MYIEDHKEKDEDDQLQVQQFASSMTAFSKCESDLKLDASLLT